MIQIVIVIDYTSRVNIPGLILFFDFQKAFDSLESTFMYQVSQKFGFGINFFSFIKSIYKNLLALIKVNGYLTEYININKGMKQGCPLSALIFIFCTEILAFSIKHNNDIQGIDLDFKSGTKTYLK